MKSKLVKTVLLTMIMLIPLKNTRMVLISTSTGQKSRDAGKESSKVQHPFIIKPLWKLCIEGTYIDIIKIMYEKQFILNWRNLTNICLKISNKLFLSLPHFQVIQQKEIKRIL